MLEEVNSPISGLIQISRFFGRPKMVIGGLEQSGSFIKSIWKKGLKKIHNSKFMIHSSLILGLGGGTAAKLVNQFWPEAKIVGIEIDPVIIGLAKKYFALGKISSLKIINADAAEWVKRKEKFDLILVDVYLGDKVPKSCETKEFLKNIKKLISPGGFVIFNRLNYKEKKKETEDFIKKLEKIFPQVSLIQTPSNLLIVGEDKT